MGWGLGRLGALWFSRMSSPPASHHILQSFVSVSAPSCPSPRRHPDCLPRDTGAGLLAPCFLSCGIRRAFLLTDVCFFEGLWGGHIMSQGLEDSGDFWRHSHCLLSQNHSLIDFVERLLIGGPPSVLSVYDDLDILKIGIACSALGIIENPPPLPLPPQCLPGICCFLVSH